MARGPRLDAPGSLHHVMVRGIERRKIFENDKDREDFLRRLGQVVIEGEATCFAQEAFYAEMPWVKMPETTVEDVVELARSKGVRYLVIDERVELGLPGFLEKIKQGDWIQRMDWKRKAQKVILYELAASR
jgi:hypothetical protein